MTNSLSGYIGMKNKFIAPQVTTSLFISEKAIKLAQSVPGRYGKKVSWLQAVSLSNKSDEEITKGLAFIFSRKTQKDLGRFILLIPRQLAALHYVKLPSTSADEIKEMSRLQAAKQLPYEPQAIILGCQTIRVTPQGFSDIILIIVHQDIIKRYLNILDKYNLEPQEITIDSQGACHWLRLQKDINQEDPVIIVDLDLGHARLDIVSSGIFIYSRAFALNSNPPEFKMRLYDEINKSITAFEKENIGKKPQNAFFTGAQEFLEYIDEDFTKGFVFKCKKCPQEQNINLKADSLVKSSDFGRNSFVSLLGMVLSSEKPSFNLLPEYILIKRQKTAYQQQMHKAAIFSFLIIMTFTAGMFVNTYLRQSKIQQLNNQLRYLSLDVSKIEKMSKKAAYVRSHLEQAALSLDALTEILRIASRDINLVFFGYEANKPLVLKGQAKTLSGVFNFVNGLEASDMFREVQVRHSSKRKVKDEELADFEIACLIDK